MRSLAAALLLLLGANTAAAQGVRPEPSAAGPIFGAVALGAIGLVGGVVVGARMDTDCSGDWCGLAGAVIGGLVGETVGVSAGAHLGNRRRGSFGLDLLGSTGVGLLAIVATANASDTPGAMLVGGAIAQITTAVLVERSTGRARERRAATVSLTRMPERRWGIAATIPLP